MPLKKAVRTLQVMMPALQEARYAGHLRMLEFLGATWRREAEAIRYFQKDHPTIVDVGANRGFSVASFLTLKPNATVIAFEPLPRQSEGLRKRFAGRNVVVLGCGLSNEEGRMTIFTPIYRGFVFDALSALRYEDAANWVNEQRFYAFNKSKLHIEEANVEIARLDRFNVAPDIIKVYTQGHESAVIAGASRTIAKYEPAVLAPARQPAIDECLQDLGYQQYSFRNKKLFENVAGDSLAWYLKPQHLPMFHCEKVSRRGPPRWSAELDRIHQPAVVVTREEPRIEIGSVVLD